MDKDFIPRDRIISGSIYVFPYFGESKARWEEDGLYFDTEKGQVGPVHGDIQQVQRHICRQWVPEEFNND